MREVWDVYTKDRRRTGKTCLRGEQGTLEEDEFHMWVMVWIKNARTGKYLVSQRSADKDTDPLKWETVAGHAVRRHIVGGANRTLISVQIPLRLCRTGICRRFSAG